MIIDDLDLYRDHSTPSTITTLLPFVVGWYPPPSWRELLYIESTMFRQTLSKHLFQAKFVSPDSSPN